LCLCDIFYFKINEGKLKTNSINRECVANSCNHCVLYYFNYRNFKFRIVRKLRETHFLPTALIVDWEMECTSIYKSKSCSKKGIRMPSFLTLHKTHTPQKPNKHFHWYSRRTRKYHRKSCVLLTVFLECFWESIYMKAFTQFYVVWL
jgi:hypothetical protein